MGGQFEKDKKRELDLLELGYRVIRFNEDEVTNDIENVNRTLQNYITDWEKNHALPPSNGESKFEKHGYNDNSSAQHFNTQRMFNCLLLLPI